jgi:hypothetical protein
MSRISTTYREHFAGIWQSATLTFTSVEVDGVHTPNGELEFSLLGESTEVLNREGALSIYKVYSTSPYDLLEQIINGEIPTYGGTGYRLNSSKTPGQAGIHHLPPESKDCPPQQKS